MRISAFFCFAEPDKLRYPYVESVSSVLPFCDEVVVLFAGSTDPSGRQFEAVSYERLASLEHPGCDIRVLVQEYWPGWKDNTYENTRRLLKLGFDSCTGDVKMKVDGDQIFRVEHAHEIRDEIVSAQNAHLIVFPRINFCGRDGFNVNWANRDIIAVNVAALNRDSIGFEISADKSRWGQPSFTSGVKEHQVTREHLLPVNYDCSFMTRDLVIDHWINADGVYSRELSRPPSFDYADRDAVLASFKEYHRRKRGNPSIRRDFHPTTIKERVSKMDPTMWGYDNFGG